MTVLAPAIVGRGDRRTSLPNLRSIAASLTTPTAFLFGGGLLPMAMGYMGETHSFGLGILFTGSLMILASGLVFFLQLLDKMEEGC